MTDITTWKQGVEYTFRTRYAWKHGSGAKTSRINCQHFTDYAGEDYPLAEITRKYIRGYQQHMEDLEIPNASINRRTAPVTTVLSHLFEEEEIDFSPPRIKRYKESQGRPWYFTKDEVDQLCLVANHRLSELIRFASCTGGRLSELLKIKAKDVDLKADQLYFGGRPGFDTKTGDWRAVPITNPIRSILEQRVIGTHPDCAIFGDEWNSGQQVLQHFKRAVKHIGKEPYYVFHSLRHSFATWNIEAGVPLRVLMDLGGWKQYQTVLRYAKATDQARTDALSSVFG